MWSARTRRLQSASRGHVHAGWQGFLSEGDQERAEPPPSFLPVTGRLLPGLGWGGIFFPCLLLLSSTGEAPHGSLAAPAHFVDEKGRRSSLRPHV